MSLIAARNSELPGPGERLVLWKLWFPALCSSICLLLPRKMRSRRGYSSGPYRRLFCGAQRVSRAAGAPSPGPALPSAGARGALPAASRP